MKHEHEHHCEEYAHLSRRGFLGRAAVVASSPAWLPKIALAQRARGPARDTLVSIFMRGGMDGLTTCVPYLDGELYNARPTLAIQPPGGGVDSALDLDGFFGLPPAAAPLLTPYGNGDLAIVHATGSTDPSRSHFDAMRFMETATPNQPANLATGWLGRYLASVAPVGAGDFRALGLGPILPRTLNGAPGTLPIPDPGAFSFPGDALTAPQRRAAVSNMYGEARATLADATVSTLATIDILETIDFAGYVPSGGAVYPATPFGESLKCAAALIKADVGVEAAHVDISGWDHHNQMGPLNGILAQLLDELTSAIEAFYLDTSAEQDRIVLVAKSEFGRRIAENGSAGTDHGHGNCMLVMGGHVAGGQVLADWPGLINSGNGDVPITTDYRDILGEILTERLGATDLTDVFPEHTVVPQGIIT